MTELKKGPYSDEENAFLREHYAEKGPTWCAEQLGRGRAALQVRACFMGLSVPGRRGEGFRATMKKAEPKPKPAPKPKGDVINRLTPEEIAAVPRFNGEIAARFVPPMSKAGPWPSILKCKAVLKKNRVCATH